MFTIVIQKVTGDLQNMQLLWCELNINCWYWHLVIFVILWERSIWIKPRPIFPYILVKKLGLNKNKPNKQIPPSVSSLPCAWEVTQCPNENKMSPVNIWSVLTRLPDNSQAVDHEGFCKDLLCIVACVSKGLPPLSIIYAETFCTERKGLGKSLALLCHAGRKQDM